MAHPGHELRLASWVRAARPCVFVLAAGSRSGAGRARIEASARLIDALGATCGQPFGAFPDKELYAAIMRGDAQVFERLAAELAEQFVARRLAGVVTDGWQLYNVVHDLWHLTVRVAAELASERLGAPVEVLDYPVVPQAMSQRRAGPVRIAIDLSPDEMEDKLRLAAAYPEIADDVAEVMDVGGRDFFAAETLHQVRPLRELLPVQGEQPAYERYGEARVAAGLYTRVLRWDHAERIVGALTAMTAARRAAA